MSKKSKSKKKKIEKETKTDQTIEENQDRNYGGLPDRDLRKNLGCG